MSGNLAKVERSSIVSEIDRNILNLGTPSAEVVKLSLHNGLTILVDQTESLPLISIDLVVKNGVTHPSSDGNRGLAHLVEHLLLRGNRFPRALAWLRDRIVGGTFFDKTEFRLCSTSSNLKQALDLMVCLLGDFDPDSEAVEIETEIIAQEIEFLNRHEEELLSNLFWNLAVFSTETHWGSRDALSFGLDEIHTFHALEYVPRNIVLAVSGDVRLGDFDKQLRELEDVKGVAKSSGVLPFRSPQARFASWGNRFLALETGSKIARGLSGYRLQPFEADRLHEIDLLSVLFNRKARAWLDDPGHRTDGVVDLHAYTYVYQDFGLVLIKSAFHHEAEPSVKALLQGIIANLRTCLVPEEELIWAKARLVNRTLSTYSTVDRARALAINEIRGGRTDLYIEALKNVSNSDVLRWAQVHLDDEKLLECRLLPASRQRTAHTLRP